MEEVNVIEVVRFRSNTGTSPEPFVCVDAAIHCDVGRRRPRRRPRASGTIYVLAPIADRLRARVALQVPAIHLGVA